MKKLTALLLSMCLVGCAADGTMSKQNIGALTGGALGGVLGNQIGGGNGRVVATIGGTLLGAMLGSSIGKSMDEVDRMKMSQALESAPTDRTVAWHNPDNGNAYQVTPVRTYQGDAGQPCREFSNVAIIGGKRQQVYGTACRQGDGSWKIVSN